MLHNVAQTVHEEMDQHIEAFMKVNQQVTSDALAASVAYCFRSAKRLPGFDPLPQKRLVDVFYGNTTIPRLVVASLPEELDLRYAAALKFHAVSTGALDKLCNEALSCTLAPRSDWKARLCSEVLASWAAARGRLNEHLVGRVATGDEAQGVATLDADVRALRSWIVLQRITLL